MCRCCSLQLRVYMREDSAESQMGPGFPPMMWYRLLPGRLLSPGPKIHCRVQPAAGSRVWRLKRVLDFEAIRMKSIFSGLLFLIFIAPGSLLAQGLFQGAGLPRAVTATGQTEVIGPIMVSMTQGPAGTGTLVIDVSPLQLTNANASDISVTGAGITVGATTIDTTNNLDQIP